MKVINHYSKNKQKISYIPFIHRLLFLNSYASTLFAGLRKKRFMNPRIKKVFIETISFCNNDCAFCPASRKAGWKYPKHKMAMETFEKIINQLHDIHFSGILALYCNNEPLIDTRILYFIKRLRKEFPLSKIEIITSGFRLNAKLANELFKSGLSELLVNYYDNSLRLSGHLKKFVREFSKNPNHNKVNIYLRLKDEVLSNRAGEAGNAKIPEKSLPLWCYLPFEQLYLNYTGDVILCCSDVLWKVVLGNINNNSIGEIWCNERFLKIRRSLLERRRDRIKTCKKCDFLGIRHEPKDFLNTMAVVIGVRAP